MYIDKKEVKQAWRDKNREAVTKYNRDYSISNKDRCKKYQSKPSNKFKTYELNAKKRGKEFNISFDEFMTFWQLPCSYCGSDIETIGLDRVDSEIGYNLNNIIPCCKICNRMKSNTPTETFINHCKKIANED
jgi:hypothetical protein